MFTAIKTLHFNQVLRTGFFFVLVALMVFLALEVKVTAVSVLANADSLIFNDSMCYSACAFIR